MDFRTPIDLYSLDLSSKTILEIGTGNGGTLLELIELLKEFPDLKIITVDIVEPDLSFIFNKEPKLKKNIIFHKADAIKLDFLKNNSIDIIVSYYTLCAINQFEGNIFKALKRFHEVLKPNGWLFLEEEFPYNFMNNIDALIEDKVLNNDFLDNTARFQVFDEYWRILKVLILSKIKNNNKKGTDNNKEEKDRISQNYTIENIYSEIMPNTLIELLKIIGFKNIGYEFSGNVFHIEEISPTLEYRIKKNLEFLPNKTFAKGILEWYNHWKQKARITEIIEFPIYSISCKK